MPEDSVFYDEIAWIYNRDWGRAYLGTACTHFDEHIAPGLAIGASILDVCCGTGQLAAALTSRGFQVTGVDLSPAMLTFAKVNAPEAEFLTGEMSGYRLGRLFQAAVCCFNSLNHATSQEHLEAALTNIAAHLSPGAPLLADLLLAEGYAQSWTSNAAADSPTAHYELEFRYKPNAKLAVCTATLTDTQAVHHARMQQRIFTLRNIKLAVRAAGFTIENVIAVRGAQPAKGRVAVVARRLR